MSKEKLISVIVPLYNAEQHIKRCIASIQAQTFKNLEIIIVDDGSSDNSFNICQLLAKNDKRIKIIQQMNQGVSVARNTGIEYANGEYISFVDNDDYISPYMYEYLYKAINNKTTDMSMCDVNVTTFYPTHDSYTEYTSFKESNKECLKNLYSTYNKDYIYMVVWNKLFKKEIIKNIRFKKTAVEDLVFVNEILQNIKEISIVPISLYHWIQHKNSASHLFSNRFIYCLDSYLDCYNKLYIYDKNIASYCLLKLYKKLIFTKYHYQNTIYETQMKEKISNIHNIIKFHFLFNRQIQFKYKLTLPFILSFSSIHSLYLKLNHYLSSIK